MKDQSTTWLSKLFLKLPVRQTLQTHILLAFIFLLLVPSMIIISFMYWQNANAVLQVSDELIAHVTGKVTEKTLNYLAPAADAAQVMAQFPEINELVLLPNEAIDLYGAEVLHTYPQLAGIFVGDEQGDFLFTKRFAEESGIYSIGTKRVDRQGVEPVEYWVYRNPDGSLLEETAAVAATYDPRQRPWYQGAAATGDVFWSDIYIFFTDQKPGITAAYPLFLENGELYGVIGVDVALDELSAFLGEQKIGESGQVMIVTEDGRVVAHPNAALAVSEEDKYRSVLISELEDPVLQVAYEKYLEAPQKSFAFKYQSKKYIASFTPMQSQFDKDWYIAIVVPQDDFLGVIKQTNLLTLIIVLGILSLALLLAVAMARTISQPIVILTEMAKQQATGDLQVKATVQGPQEIEALADAFNSLTEQVRGQIDWLESEVAARTALLQATVETGRQANATLDLEALVDQVVDFVNNNFSFYHTAVFLSDKEGKRLTQAAVAGEQRSYFLDKIPMLDINNESMMGTAALTKEPQVANNVHTSKSYMAHSALPKTKAEATFPLITENRVIGILDVQDVAGDRFSGRMMDALEGIAHQIAIAVSNAQAFLQLQETAVALKEAKEVAEEATLAKSEFLAGITHELRTPLNAIIGLSDLLIETEVDDEQEDYVSTLRQSANTLLALINDVLDFSKIDVGRMELEQEPFLLQKCLNDVSAIAAIAAEEKGLIIEMTVASDVPPAIVGDIVRLRQIILNLLGNAVKFTDKGRIHLTVNRLQSTNEQGFKLQFSVQDSGIGIPSDKVNRLFESFRQIDASTTRKYGGTGLGLAISKRLAEAMGGSMWVESDGLGTGSTFFFTMRTIQAAADFSEAKQSQTTGIESELAVRHPLTILLVDDNLVNQKVGNHLLRKLGYVPVIASNGQEAVTLMEQTPFSTILMDVQMPVMDGLEATRLIRERIPEADQPFIIAMTANAMKGDRERFLAAGMDEYISKPVKLNVLSKQLAAAPAAKSTGAVTAVVVEPIAPIVEIAEANTKSPLNKRSWAQLEETMEEMLDQLIEIFLDDSKDLMAQIEDAVKRGDADALQHAAHTFKGNSNTLAAHQLAEYARDLELSGRNNTMDGTTENLPLLQQEYQRVVVALQAKINAN